MKCPNCGHIKGGDPGLILVTDDDQHRACQLLAQRNGKKLDDDFSLWFDESTQYYQLQGSRLTISLSRMMGLLLDLADDKAHVRRLLRGKP